jgi:hypothetical protein
MSMYINYHIHLQSLNRQPKSLVVKKSYQTHIFKPVKICTLESGTLICSCPYIQSKPHPTPDPSHSCPDPAKIYISNAC